MLSCIVSVAVGGVRRRGCATVTATKRATAKKRATAAQTRSIRDGRVIVRKELGTTERFPRLALCPCCHLGLCPLVLLILDLTRHHFHFPYRATLRFGAFSMSTAVSAGSESLQGRRHYPLYGASGLRGMKKVISLSLGTRTASLVSSWLL